MGTSTNVEVVGTLLSPKKPLSYKNISLEVRAIPRVNTYKCECIVISRIDKLGLKLKRVSNKWITLIGEQSDFIRNQQTAGVIHIWDVVRHQG